MEKWQGSVAVVTGASAGIGKAIALILAEHGMNVAALARREDRLKEMSEKFKGKGSIKGYKCDVSQESDIKDVFNRIEKDMGIIQVLVNNAGVAIFSKMTDFEMDKWRQMFEVNVLGMFTCIKYVLNSAKAKNVKDLIHVININSIAGHQPTTANEGLVYSATKHCVTMLTRGLLKQIAIENLSNIKLTSISPGVVATDIFEVGGWGQVQIEKIAHLKPEDIANGVVTALSESKDVVISELTMKAAGEQY